MSILYYYTLLISVKHVIFIKILLYEELYTWVPVTITIVMCYFTAIIRELYCDG